MVTSICSNEKTTTELLYVLIFKVDLTLICFLFAVSTKK